MKRTFLLLAVAAALSGCGLVYTNVRLPRSYRSATPAEVKSDAGDRAVTGESCNQSLLYLVAWGDAGYAAAAKAALEPAPDMVLYDVRVDQKVTSVLLGVYTRTCTIVTAKAAKR